ncbi:MAG: alanine racemase [Planctomycetota bacterium]|jgi:uncharacterized pyridoxal phosphate-containing UPF0001 family protein
MDAPDPARNYRRIREALPPEVRLVVAAKGRTTAEVAQVIEAGADLIGHNYVQEAERMRARLGEAAGRVQWHLIGHLQRNKVNRALPLFSVIQSVGSLRLARAIDGRADRTVRVYVEVNVAGEKSKYGCPPEAARGLVEEMAGLEKLRIEGLRGAEGPRCAPRRHGGPPHGHDELLAGRR